jgi:hypothetical protein
MNDPMIFDPMIAVLFGFLGALSALLAANAIAKSSEHPRLGDALWGNALVMMAWAAGVFAVGVLALLD